MHYFAPAYRFHGSIISYIILNIHLPICLTPLLLPISSAKYLLSRALPSTILHDFSGNVPLISSLGLSRKLERPKTKLCSDFWDGYEYAAHATSVASLKRFCVKIVYELEREREREREGDRKCADMFQLPAEDVAKLFSNLGRWISMG